MSDEQRAMSKSYQYGNIDRQEESPRESNILRTSIVIGLATVLLFLGIAGTFGMTPLSTKPKELLTTEALDMEGSAKDVRSCTFEECYSTACDASSAPFACLFNNGGPHGGCSATPWVKGTCSDQCNLSGCDELDIPLDVKSCVGEPCPQDWCKGGQVCPDLVPFQCVEGSARFGCSDDSLHWTLRVGVNTCGKCCDTTTC